MSNSFVTSWTTAHHTPLSMGFPRQEYWVGWVAISSSRGTSQPRDQTHISALVVKFFFLLLSLLGSHQLGLFFISSYWTMSNVEYKWWVNIFVKSTILGGNCLNIIPVSFLKMIFIILGKFTYSPYMRGWEGVGEEKMFHYEWVLNSFTVFPASIETIIYMVSFVFYCACMMNYTDCFSNIK